MARIDRVARGDVDHFLDRAVAAWDGLANIEREISTWDLEDQLAFVEEWPREEERLARLAELAQAGAFDDDQRARYGRLLALVKHNRPVATRLFPHLTAPGGSRSARATHALTVSLIQHLAAIHSLANQRVAVAVSSIDLDRPLRDDVQREACMYGGGDLGGFAIWLAFEWEHHKQIDVRMLGRVPRGIGAEQNDAIGDELACERPARSRHGCDPGRSSTRSPDVLGAIQTVDLTVPPARIEEEGSPLCW